MFATILIVGLAFYWLLRETDYFRIHLIRGAIPVKPKAYAKYTVHAGFSKKNYEHVYNGQNFPEDEYPQNVTHYDLVFSPGITAPLCGYDWLNEHCADLVHYSPEVYMSIGNVRYSMTIKDTSVIKDIMRVNKLSKKEIQALA